ncbi:hypothetical protein PVT67_04330 [Gallaecimonas kandeliae]|uniref:hypothetical protein n=1 Tax=Gallaecimonas kandeliae TaxID=3029055 RepID=UPI002649D30E|nr:hypothetical protein [Gallaecimonas kandeliae]WKE66483.1 hypothetical protein PVT67_04330 [Gallaecimonas kandeliae]
MSRISSLILLAAGLLSGCASHETAPTYPHSDIAVKYHIRHFAMDMATSDSDLGKNLLQPGKAKVLVQTQLIKKLRDKGLLADKNDVNVVDLDIFVDYVRHFVGDGTPFPTDKLREPNMRLTITNYLGDEVLYFHESPVFDRVKGVALGGMLDDDQKLQYAYLSATVNSLIEATEDDRQFVSDAFSFKTKGLNEEAIIAKRRYTEKPPIVESKPVGLASKDYIPSTVVQPYLQALASGDRDKRIDTDKALLGTWFYSKELYDRVQKQVLDNYLGTDPEMVKEAIWATKALAYSGLEQYRSTVVDVANLTKDEKLKKYALKYQRTMTERVVMAKAIHDVSTMDPSLDWRANQLSNMLRSGDGDLRDFAVKTIYKDYGKNAYLLAQLSHILDTEARSDHFRYGGQSDFYAWACRVLGVSGDKGYKPLLDDMAQHAASPMVREYAEKFAGKLD